MILSELRDEKNLKFKNIKDAFSTKFDILENSLYQSGNILCSSILDEFLFIGLSNESNASLMQFLSKILIKEFNYKKKLDNKENCDINFIKIPSYIAEKCQYGQIFKVLLMEKKILSLGIFRTDINKRKYFITNPEFSEKLNPNDIILFFGKQKIIDAQHSLKKSTIDDDFNINSMGFKSSQNFEHEDIFLKEKRPFDLIALAKKVIEEDESLDIKDNDILNNFIKESKITENQRKKLLEQNEILKKLLMDYEKALKS